VPAALSLLAALIVLPYMPAPAIAAQDNSSLATHRSPINRFTGVYEVAPEKFIYIQPWPGAEGKLLYTGEDNQIRALSPAAENVFVAGPGLLLATPAELKIMFGEDPEGHVIRLIRRRTGAPDAIANRLKAYRQPEVSFQNGGVSLAAALHLPPGNGPHPALVLIHGTGRTDRDNVLPITHFLVTHGVALLGYDKRGVGESSGDWRSASLEDLAGDAAAAVRYLASRKDIDRNKIGVFGASQGGWLVPLAAAESKDVAFAITVSGPAMSPAELEVARLAQDLRARGFSADDVSDALELLKLGNDVARGKEKWESYQPALERSRNAQWFRYVSVPLTPDSWLWSHWRSLPLDFNPAPAIAKMRIPVLALFGSLDKTVLPSENVRAWKAAWSAGRSTNFTIRILPGANHMLLEAQTGSDDEFPMLQRFVPEYEPALLGWLRDRGIIAK